MQFLDFNYGPGSAAHASKKEKESPRGVGGVIQGVKPDSQTLNPEPQSLNPEL